MHVEKKQETCYSRIYGLLHRALKIQLCIESSLSLSLSLSSCSCCRRARLVSAALILAPAPHTPLFFFLLLANYLSILSLSLSLQRVKKLHYPSFFFFLFAPFVLWMARGNRRARVLQLQACLYKPSWQGALSIVSNEKEKKEAHSHIRLVVVASIESFRESFNTRNAPLLYYITNIKTRERVKKIVTIILCSSYP